VHGYFPQLATSLGTRATVVQVDPPGIGRIYRETTPEMLARVVAAIEQRLTVALKVASDQRAQLGRNPHE
jgi:hypothetical protein